MIFLIEIHRIPLIPSSNKRDDCISALICDEFSDFGQMLCSISATRFRHHSCLLSFIIKKTRQIKTHKCRHPQTSYNLIPWVFSCGIPLCFFLLFYFYFFIYLYMFVVYWFLQLLFGHTWYIGASCCLHSPSRFLSFSPLFLTLVKHGESRMHGDIRNRRRGWWWV